MQGSMVDRQAWLGALRRRLSEQVARYLGEIAAYWNRHPIDRFWPPHP